MTATDTMTTGTTDLADHPPAPLNQLQNQRQNPFLTVVLVLLGVMVALIAIAALGVIALRSGSSTESTVVNQQAEIVSPPAAVVPPAATTLAWLRVDGLGDFSFGDDANAVISGLTATFGEPTTQQVRGDCPGSIATLVTFNGLTLHMSDAHLMGWVYTGSSPALVTPSGVAVGTSLDSLTATYSGVNIFESSLGTEFHYEVPSGYIAGFVDGQSVTSLYAGETCFFR